MFGGKQQVYKNFHPGVEFTKICHNSMLYPLFGKLLLENTSQMHIRACWKATRIWSIITSIKQQIYDINLM
jgi:hypothetical protein